MAKDGTEWLKKEKPNQQKTVLRPFQQSTCVLILWCWVLWQRFTEFVSQTLKKSWLPPSHWHCHLSQRFHCLSLLHLHPLGKFLLSLSLLLHTRCLLAVHYFLALYPSVSDHISQIILRYFRNYYLSMPPVLKPLFLHFPQLYIGRSKKQKLLAA